MAKLLITLLLLLNTGIAFTQKTYAFFGCYNWDKNKKGIYVYELDTIYGNLTPVTSIAVHNPSYLTLSPSGKFIYACTNTKTPGGGSVSSFEFNPAQKSITNINSQPSGGENPVYVSVHKNGKWLANANYTDGSTSVYPIAANGSILPMKQNFHYIEGSVNKNRQERSHVHSAVFSPDHDYLFLPDLGADKIRTYAFSELSDSPLQLDPNHEFTKTDNGSGPRHLTFHPNKKYGYCIEELSGNVSVYTYNNGTLKNIQTIAAHTSNIKDSFESSDIHISPDGKFLYATNRGKENNIAIFSIEDNGTLKTVGYQQVYGLHPRIFAIDPSGNFIITANVNSSNAVVFKRDKKTGLLTKTGNGATIENVSCVQLYTY